jgi:hypothetical protein
MKKCEACGTTKNINGSLGGVLLCKEHFADISAQVEQMHAEGKQVNVMGIARRIYREANDTGNYILRDVPAELMNAAKHKAIDEGISLRELIMDALRQYLK